MSSITAALEALDRAVEMLGAVDLDGLGAAERYRVAEHLETSRRRQVAVFGSLLCGLEQVEGCPPVLVALSDVLRISRREARRRIRDAEQLAPRVTLTGQPVPPVLPATAKAWDAGVLDGEHLVLVSAAIDGRALAATRPTFGGSLLCTIMTLAYRPQMATVRPRVMQMPRRDDTRSGDIVDVHLACD